MNAEHIRELKDRVLKNKRNTLFQAIALFAINDNTPIAARIEGLEMAQHLVGALLETLREEQEGQGDGE